VAGVLDFGHAFEAGIIGPPFELQGLRSPANRWRTNMSKLRRAARGTRDRLLTASLVLVIAGCGGDGCAGCDLAPLPGDALPADQTVEGGAQVRVAPAGFEKVEQVVGGIINDALGEGICIPEGSQGVGIGDVEFCYANDGNCAPGCQADLTIDSVSLTPEPGQLRITAQFDVQSDVAVRFDPIIGGDTECTLNVTADDTLVEALVAVGTDPASGELTVSLLDIPGFELDASIDGCGVIGDIIDFLGGLLGGVVEDLVLGLLEPQLNELIAQLLPDPLGIENTIDLGGFLSTLSPGTTGALEARVVPGGYAFVEGGGLSVGIISGVNTDRDPATREPALDSEPALCVPQMAAPDLAAPPASLPVSERGNFMLPAADAFRGAPEDPDSDVAVGVSETFLDLAGHHLITSGGLCLGLGTELIPQLNLGTIGILVPSLAELGASPEGDDPLLLITRPTRAIDFTVGEGTEESPSLTVQLSGFEIDFYAFLFQRYVRGFTVGLDLNVGVNLEFATDEEGNPTIMPILIGLDAENIGVTVHNAEFLREGSEELAGLLPSLIEVALPLLTDALPAIEVPELLGFRLDQLRLGRVTTDQDDFLAIYATLTASQTLARLTERFPGLAGVHQKLAGAAPAPAPRATAAGKARLARVSTPRPDVIRAHLRGDEGAMPSVEIEVPTHDELGRELEWTWNLGGGVWRPFRRGGTLAIAEGAFAIQGRYQIQLKSRVVGDYHTLSTDAAVVPVIIDSVAPRILRDKVAVEEGAVVVPAVDLVSPPEKVELAFGGPNDDGEPVTDWGNGRISVEQAGELAAGSGTLTAWARDEMGNVSSALIDVTAMVPSESPSAGGCACQTGGGARSAGGLALLVLGALLGLGRRRRSHVRSHERHDERSHVRSHERHDERSHELRHERSDERSDARADRTESGREPRWRRAGRLAALFLAGAALASQPACSCGNSGGEGSEEDDDGEDDDGGPVCEVNDDCADQCEPGTVPICEDAECRCEGDVQWGRIGQFSEMAVGGDGTVFVSAYNSYHGDLMVAARSEDGRIPDESWQFVDGVPEGPVLVPGSDVRGGINEPGPNVGLYTDIAASGDGAVVSYHDADTASLRFTSNRSGAWVAHVVDEGAPGAEGSYEIVGQYSAITVREDGRPGIAYFAHVADGKGERTELRFAEASSADPAQASDWTVTVVDGAPVPEPTADPLPIPMGVGLFASAARLSDGSPVVVYYDRVNGDLKAARGNAEGGFDAPQVLDGPDVDAGWYPGVAVDGSDQLHVSYVNAGNHDLLYVNTADGVVELIDDGYREVGETEGGVPIPDYHFVGDDSGVVLDESGRPVVAYQDATSHELLVARKDEAGVWTRETLAGAEDPFTGGYGFYISAAMADGEMVLSTWVVDQPNEQAWVEILRADGAAPPVE
jgi:MYXO-CTERM domain-containing protein